MSFRFRGLTTATLTPFTSNGDLNLSVVEQQAEYLNKVGVKGVFVGGTTGEWSSLTVPERMALTERWAAVLKGSKLWLTVHVGSNSVGDSKALASHAEKHGASAVSMLSPSYFKPKNVDAIVRIAIDVAAACPATPFYFYDIPSLTGVTLPMGDFLDSAGPRIPNLAGLKFTNADLASYQRCLNAGGGRFDIPYGIDEFLLAAMALGGKGAVGSGYNFSAPIFVRMLAAFEASDWETARREQYRSVQLVTLFTSYGYLAAAKAAMTFLGVPVGEVRLPLSQLTALETNQLRNELMKMGFFDWVAT